MPSNTKQINKSLRAVSLFSGAGGMDLGFENAGIKIVLANELAFDAAKTYEANHPRVNIVNDDVSNVLSSLNAFKGTDIVFGGPPCQGFSVAGKMNPADTRSKLIFTFLDAVANIEPKAFIMENVKALATLNKWESVRKEYLLKVNDLGYVCCPFVLNAIDFGVPQKRERVFFVGIKSNEFDTKQFWNLLEKRHKKAPIIKDVLLPLGKAGTKTNPKTSAAKIKFCARPIMRKSAYAGMYFNGQGRPIDINGYANTLPASMGGNKTPFIDEAYLFGDEDDNFIENYHKGLMTGTIKPAQGEAPSRLRRITIKEAAKIQTFPDDYVFVGKCMSIYRQIGNAVPCKLAEAVASALVEYLGV